MFLQTNDNYMDEQLKSTMGASASDNNKKVEQPGFLGKFQDFQLPDSGTIQPAKQLVVMTGKTEGSESY